MPPLLAVFGFLPPNDTTAVRNFHHAVGGAQGAAYGMAPYFRFSFALSMECLTEACRRSQRACADLR